MKVTKYLSIADFIIRLEFYDQDIPFYKNKWLNDLHKHFHPFLIKKTNQKISHTIRFIDPKVYSIFEDKNTGGKGIVYYKETAPLITTTYYAIGLMQFESILMHVISPLLINKSGFYFHASSILVKDGVILFTGNSGSGKTTAASLLKKIFPIFTDDFIIIRKYRNQFVGYQALRYEKIVISRTRKCIPLKGIIFLRKSNKISIKNIVSQYLIEKEMSEQTLISEPKYALSFQNNYIYFMNSFRKYYLLSFSLHSSKVLKLMLQNFQQPQVSPMHGFPVQ